MLEKVTRVECDNCGAFQYLPLRASQKKIKKQFIVRQLPFSKEVEHFCSEECLGEYNKRKSLTNP